MKCVIEGSSVKVFGRAIHALARISDELCLDPLEKGLALRSVNLAHSAYACFIFSPPFFQKYAPVTGPTPEGKETKYKLTIKSLLPLFRCLVTIDRSVDRCQICTNLPDTRVTFQFICRHGITKTYVLAFEECEALQAVFPAHLCANILKAQPRLLGDIVVHFPSYQEEITLSISEHRVILQNYCEEGRDQRKIMSTKMSLHPNEFDNFHVMEKSDITFCLKELRGLLSFAESYGLPVSVHFGPPGQPVCFGVEDVALEARVVLATLLDESYTSTPALAAPRSKKDPYEFPCHVDPALNLYQMEEPLPPSLTPSCRKLGEMVPSSQGSPVLSKSAVMRCTLELPTTAPPAVLTPEVRSLLFSAVSSPQADEQHVPHPSLACASDTDEEADDSLPH